MEQQDKLSNEELPKDSSDLKVDNQQQAAASQGGGQQIKFLQVELLEGKEKIRSRCLRNWIIGFATGLGVLFFLMSCLYFVFDKGKSPVYKDTAVVGTKICHEKWKKHENWGPGIVLLMVGGLFGYALYLVKGVYDSEAYERKKNLELDRKLHQEKVAHNMNEAYWKYQQEKEGKDRDFAREKVYIGVVHDINDAVKELDNLKKDIGKIVSAIDRKNDLSAVKDAVSETISKCRNL